MSSTEKFLRSLPADFDGILVRSGKTGPIAKMCPYDPLETLSLSYGRDRVVLFHRNMKPYRWRRIRFLDKSAVFYVTYNPQLPSPLSGFRKADHSPRLFVATPPVTQTVASAPLTSHPVTFPRPASAR